ncbi:MAG: winged helix-turn-helix domain-containing protein [Lysobacter sp.]|nr:winged helix-turn-helix domain-containing protein [Lysobacter sp.]
MHRERDLGVHRFGEFELDEADRVLRRQGRRVKLATRGFDLLALLVRNAGRLVTKDEILRVAWAGRVVEESNIHVQVSALRKLLGHPAIATVTGLGYRFDQPVSGVAGEAVWERSNLPNPPSPLVGRGSEMAHLVALLDSARLVTLKGVAGIGKTRLAIQAGHERLRLTADRVWFADLVPATGVDAIVLALLQARGRLPKSGSPLFQTLTARLRETPTLIILDNCEHVAADVASLCALLLKSCPELRILCTSRQSIGLAGGHLYEVPPLSEADATKLFLARASAAAPHFLPGEQDRPVIARIMGRLEGLSLAIELAAARLRAVSLEELDRLLDDRLRVLTGGDTTGTARQGTLEATLDWSYAQLPEPEQRLCRRLSVFATPFSVDDALGVCAEPHEDRVQVIDLLTSLVDKSLIQPQAGPGVQRFGQFETIRAFGRMKLEQAGEMTEIRSRHAHHYRDICQAARAAHESGQWVDGPARIRDCHPDILAALRWALEEGGDAVAGAELAIGVFHYWIDEWLLPEALRWLRLAMASSPGLPPLLQGQLLQSLGVLHKDLGRFAESAEFLARSVDILAALPDARAEWAVSCNELGISRLFLREFDEARLLYKQALAVFREQGIRWRVGHAQMNLSRLDFFVDDIAAAEKSLPEAARTCRESGNRRAECISLMWLAECALDRGAAASALELCQQALQARSPSVDDVVTSVLRSRMAKCAAIAGDGDLARRSLGEALDINAKNGHVIAVAECLDCSVVVAAALAGQPVAARLAGVADAWREAHESMRMPVRVRQVGQMHARLHKQLGKREFEAEYRAGAALSFADALEEIRALASGT